MSKQHLCPCNLALSTQTDVSKPSVPRQHRLQQDKHPTPYEMQTQQQVMHVCSKQCKCMILRKVQHHRMRRNTHKTPLHAPNKALSRGTLIYISASCAKHLELPVNFECALGLHCCSWRCVVCKMLPGDAVLAECVATRQRQWLQLPVACLAVPASKHTQICEEVHIAHSVSSVDTQQGRT